MNQDRTPTWITVRWLLAGTLALWLGVGIGASPVAAAGRPPVETLEKIRVTYPSEWGVPYPAGIAYIEDDGQFLYVNKQDTAETESTSVAIVTPYEDYGGTVQLDFALSESVNIAFDNHARRLFLLDPLQARLAQVALDDQGMIVPATLVWHDMAALRLDGARGIAVDGEGSTLYILENGSTLVRIHLAGSDSLEDAAFDRLRLPRRASAHDLRGLAVHPHTGHLYVLSRARQHLYELTPSGWLVAGYALDHLNLVDPQGMVWATSPDLTDDPEEVHLFIADSYQPDRSPVRASRVSRSAYGWAHHRHGWHGHAHSIALGTATDETPGGSVRYGEILEIELTQAPVENGCARWP